MLKKHVLGATMALACAALLLPMGAASAAPVTAGPNAEQRAEMDQFLDEQGYAPEIAEALITKWADGESWDSMEGGTPLSSTTEIVAGNSVTTDTYADGSRNTVSVPLAATVEPGTIQPRAVGEVNNCRRSTIGITTQVRSCQIRGVSGFITMYATMGYDHKYQGGQFPQSVRMTSFDSCNASIVGSGHSYSNISCGRIRQNATSSLSALGRYAASTTTWNGTFAVTLEAFVNLSGVASSRINSNI